MYILELAILIPLTTGICEVLKRWKKIDSDDMPFVALIAGFVITLVGWFTIPDTGIVLGEALFMGIIAGLSSAGLYDNGKSAKAFGLGKKK